jgi:uncharacterized protein DUF6265
MSALPLGVVLVVTAMAMGAEAAPKHEARRSEKAAQLTIDRVAWMHGCWRMTTPQSIVEEQWMAPRGGTMIGVGRTVARPADAKGGGGGERTTDYEFVVLKEQNGQLAYEAHPAGQAPALFMARETAADSVVFENAAHDFPQRVGYRRSGNGLVGWIEGTQNGKSRRIEFTYTRVACVE